MSDQTSEKITIELNREEWIKISLFLSQRLGEMVDIVPAIKMTQNLMRTGITKEELGV
jgi:hypothetical protein